ncbi:hypothetical protein WJX73_001237 [Symbiochloris irregularis]|uniref:Uncharacterized protein n=1 Tax=Symbiochloris irregularis TaxID=706552 RepID=A0AAW1NNV8_9CHLO
MMTGAYCRGVAHNDVRAWHTLGPTLESSGYASVVLVNLGGATMHESAYHLRQEWDCLVAVLEGYKLLQHLPSAKKLKASYRKEVLSAHPRHQWDD